MTRAGTGLDGENARAPWVPPTWSCCRIPSCSRCSCTALPPPRAIPRSPPRCRRTFEVLWHLVHERTGSTDEEILEFFSMGMMMNVIAAIDLLSVSDHWARSLCPCPKKEAAIQAASPGPAGAAGHHGPAPQPGRAPRRYPHEPARRAPFFDP